MTVSPMPGPRTVSRSVAVSRTVRLTHSSTDSAVSSRIGPSEIRPWLGFRPTSPQHDAGMRIEPPPSLACANGTMPLATAAAEPPLEPPGDRLMSHGLWVAPQAIGSVVGTLPSSGLLVRPAITRPAPRKRVTSVVSASETTDAFFSARLPLVMGWPAYPANRSLMRNGTPRNGPSGSAARAVSRAWSNQRITTALSTGSMRSIRSMAASSNSSGVTSPSWTRAAWSTASIHRV